MSQNLQTFVKFQKFQLENLVDFEKCCKTHIFLQKSEPIQPKTSNILPKFCQPTLSDVSAVRAPAEAAEAASPPRTLPAEESVADLVAAHGGWQQTARCKGRDAHAALEVGELAAAERRVVAAVAQVPAVVLVAQTRQRC